MNILFVVPYMPTPVRVRPYNFICQLAKLGHQVTVLTLWENEKEREFGEKMRGWVHRVEMHKLSAWRKAWNVARTIPTRTPLQAVYSWSPRVAVRMGELVGKEAIDCVHVEHLRGSKYAMMADGMGLPVVWDSVDCITALFSLAREGGASQKSRMMSQFELARTSRWEGEVVGTLPMTVVTSRMDADALNNLGGPHAPIHVIENGVDLSYFSVGKSQDRELKSLVVSGKMSYHANEAMVLWLVREVMPKIWAKFPETKLKIVGKDPTDQIIQLSNHKHITVTGTVDDMRPYLQKATVAVAPIQYGVGIQNKLLEAMACGTPVVTTSTGARGLRAARDGEIFVGDSAEEFSGKVVELLNSAETRRTLAQAGHRYVSGNHNWTEKTEKLAELYKEARSEKLGA